MIGLLVTTHGVLAEGLLSAALEVVHEGRPAVSVTMPADRSSVVYEQRLRAAITRLDCSSGVLALTDMFGGTPSNICLSLHSEDEIEVLTGANLAMVVEALRLTDADESLGALAGRVKRAGIGSIVIAGELLAVPLHDSVTREKAAD